MRFVACVVSLALVTSSALAEVRLPPVPELVLDEPDVGQAISPMLKGQRAPFTGILLSPSAAAEITVEIESIPEKVDIEVSRAKGLAKADCQRRLDILRSEKDGDAREFQARLTSQRDINSLLTERVKRLEKQSGDVRVWFGVGTVVGMIATISIAYAMK